MPLPPSLTELEEEKETVDALVEITPVFPLISSNNEFPEEVSKKDETRSQGAFSSSLKIEPINLPIDTKPMIKGRPLKTLEDIFDAKAFSNTTFAKFQILWEKIGGTLKGTKSGGSHRSILLNGKVIGGTFVPHGGHGYGKRCIKELRDVLTLAGYGSDYLDD
ncbi:MAG: hypothetical protein GW748_01830 [Alphaproteobacteria bacterium]|nr:hypothetical protein [Alphaproteobacteria bacterium]NCQ66470.1 hypothetical protein [Alphaproteobacteria bacterium]